MKAKMTEHAKKFRGLLIVTEVGKESEVVLWALEHDATEEYAALLDLKQSTEAPRDVRYPASNWNANA